MNVAKLPQQGERWQFKHWRQLSSARSGAGRGGVTVERVVGQGEHPSAADATRSTASLELPLFLASYDHAPDLPAAPVVEERRHLRAVRS